MSLRAYEADFANNNEAAAYDQRCELREASIDFVRASGDVALRAAQEEHIPEMPTPRAEEPFRNKGVEPIYECPGYSLAYSPSR